MALSEGLAGIDWDDYPVECRTRFLALSQRARNASTGAKRHFIYPECDEVLDAYLLWFVIETSPTEAD